MSKLFFIILNCYAKNDNDSSDSPSQKSILKKSDSIKKQKHVSFSIDDDQKAGSTKKHVSFSMADEKKAEDLSNSCKRTLFSDDKKSCTDNPPNDLDIPTIIYSKHTEALINSYKQSVFKVADLKSCTDNPPNDFDIPNYPPIYSKY
ncbi:hypothetical protein [Alphaproteobacteria bacterium endosymbiont of Tiliacea citrago]|uniref:hypothetical protein n=1 Tax=Alphaproteobacteria bacterium endosymbiont of Tiliacea citrago TaxID=3077944 RepID=UPI00313CE8E5